MGKLALITGASTGIGKELSYIHAATGGDLIIVARRKEKLDQLKVDLENKYSIHVKVIVKDLSLPNAAKEIYTEIKDSGLKVDYLINNAGFGGVGKFYERKWEEDHAMLMVNIMALTSLSRLFLPDFVRRNSGRILNVSSSAAFLPGPLQAVYYASKSYVTSLSNALAEELHDTNVTVTALMPEATETEFAKVSGMDKTAGFSTGYNAHKVALEGYNGMLKGELNIVSALFSQKLMVKLIPFMPRKMLLKEIRKMQEV